MIAFLLTLIVCGIAQAGDIDHLRNALDAIGIRRADGSAFACSTGYVDVTKVDTNEAGQVYYTCSSDTLTYLYVNGFDTLTTLPDEFFSELALTSITDLRTLKNGLTTVADPTVITALTFLDFRHNALTAVPDLSALTSLQYLKLKGNALTAVPNLSALTALVNIELQDNPYLTCLPTLPPGKQFDVPGDKNQFMADLPAIIKTIVNGECGTSSADPVPAPVDPIPAPVDPVPAPVEEDTCSEDQLSVDIWASSEALQLDIIGGNSIPDKLSSASVCTWSSDDLGADTKALYKALANRMYSTASSWCLFTVDTVDDVLFKWNGNEGNHCWQRKTLTDDFDDSCWTEADNTTPSIDLLEARTRAATLCPSLEDVVDQLLQKVADLTQMVASLRR